jgi:reticulon-4-interacting protein 1, mitochondrial
MVLEQTRLTPRPGRAGHVLVKVMAAGLNPVDAKQVVGDKVPPFLQGIVSKLLLSRQDVIPGFDFSGIVVDENGHEGFTPGDCVYGCMPPFHGTLAEYISVPTHQVAYMNHSNINATFNSSNSFIQAAALPLVGLTAYQCLQPHIPSKNSLVTSILIIGASGGTGHVALQVARQLSAQHRTAICSMSNADFVQRDCGATGVVDYNTNTIESLLAELRAAPGCPYNIVLDCVTSADARDASRIDYRKLVQEMKTHDMLTNDYVHRRLGGPTRDWIRAGWERFVTGSAADTATLSSSSFNSSFNSSLASCCGNCCWTMTNAHEKLFWIRLPHSSRQLQILQEMAQGSSLSKNDTAVSLYKRRNNNLKVQIQHVYPMTAETVNRAFSQILQRRVQGKIVIAVHHENSDNNHDNNSDNGE